LFYIKTRKEKDGASETEMGRTMESMKKMEKRETYRYTVAEGRWR
jgi:hypothetical protein